VVIPFRPEPSGRGRWCEPINQVLQFTTRYLSNLPLENNCRSQPSTQA
jgi:hypothetical protein